VADKISDVVVLLPGLIGSVLQKDGKTLWGTSPGALWNVVVGKALKQIIVSGADNGQDDLGDGVTATGLIPNPEIIPGLWKQGGYSRLSAEMVSALSLRPGHNFFEFPYDWRRDNRVSARRLAKSAHSWLKDWREESGNSQAKLILVSHSMGGLVARYFMECLDGWKDIRMLVSFGTPFRGSGNAVDFLSNGFRWKVGPLSAFDGTDALRSFESVYQLLPIYSFIGEGAYLQRPADVDIPNIERQRAIEAARFHQEMTDAYAAHQVMDEYVVRGPKLRVVIGTEQPTPQSARVLEGRTELLQVRQGK